MPVSTTEEEITSTSSRHALSMKTKSFAWRAWPSRIWSRTTRWQRPSVMSDGASLSANWNTSPNGTDEPLSRLTAGIPLPRPVMHASMYSTPYPWTDVNGYVLNVVWFTTVTPMPLSTFRRRGSPSRPVEAMEVLFGRRLDRRLPVKQETLIREDEKPHGFWPWGDVTSSLFLWQSPWLLPAFLQARVHVAHKKEIFGPRAEVVHRPLAHHRCHSAQHVF